MPLLEQNIEELKDTSSRSKKTAIAHNEIPDHLVKVLNSAPKKAVLVRNETPDYLNLKGDNNSVIRLAPLQRIDSVCVSDLGDFDFRSLARLNLLRYEEVEPRSRVEDAIAPFIGISFLFVILGTIFSLNRLSTGWAPQYWRIGSVVLGLSIVVTLVIAKRWTKKVFAYIWQSLSIVLLFVIGVGMPWAAIYFRDNQSQMRPPNLGSQSGILPLAMQFIFIVTASIFPCMLYFLFDRQCLATLRSRFEQSIFRLDPSVSTLTDVRAKYGRQMEEIYGQDNGTLVRDRLNPRGTPFPILGATILFALGWIYALLPFGGLPVHESADLFTPTKSAAAFGFLGAYFFALNDILHRYIRRDLKPKAYSSISVRILVVAILANVITILPNTIDKTTKAPYPLVLAFIFLVGIVPETALTYIREATRPITGRLLKAMDEKDPLTDLDGVDLYDRTRLMDEGVTNIEALAHHDFVDLMMETRIPVARLVDWVDQSILYLHVRGEQLDEGGLRAQLRRYGIRTATDLLQVCEQHKGDDQNALLEALTGVHESGKLNRLKIIIEALSDDEWLEYIRHWRANRPARHITVPATHQTSDTSIFTPVAG